MSTGQAISGLADIIINYELLRRPARLRDYRAENDPLIALARTLADSPDQIWQRLAEIALQLCQADSAGISLIEQKDGEEVIRWKAVVGAFSNRLNTTLTKDATPCGCVIDRNAIILMHRADEAFSPLKSEPPRFEILGTPFQVDARPVGTVWIAAHDPYHKFDQTD